MEVSLTTQPPSEAILVNLGLICFYLLNYTQKHISLGTQSSEQKPRIWMSGAERTALWFRAFQNLVLLWNPAKHDPLEIHIQFQLFSHHTGPGTCSYQAPLV